MARKKQRIAERGSLLEVPAVDWISASTKNGGQHELVRQWFDQRNEGRDFNVATSYGYEIETYNFGSLGVGMVEGAPSYLVTCSGIDSDNLAGYLVRHNDFVPSLWNCSRLDIQVTVTKDRKHSLAKLSLMFNEGELGKFTGRGKPEVYAYNSASGDTLYVGSRTSNKMHRYYDKWLVVKGRERLYERFEMELKDDRSNGMWRDLFKSRNDYDRERIKRALKYHFNTLPLQLQDELSVRHYLNGVTPEDATPVISDKEPSKHLKWVLSLRKTLTSAARLPDGDGERVQAMLLQAIVESLSPDPLESWFDWQLLAPDGTLYKLTPEVED